MDDTKDGEEDESVLSVTVYRSLLRNTEMLLPGFSIKNFQSPPRKDPRKGIRLSFTKSQDFYVWGLPIFCM